MKKYLLLGLSAILAFSMAACSSGNDDPESPDNNQTENPGGNTGTENPGDNTGGDNTGGDNTGSDNTGGDNNGDSTGSTTKVIFQDDFEGVDGKPNPEYWVLCEKGTSNWARYLSESYDQAYVENNELHLIGEKVDGVYKTGGIETRGKFDFQYGKVECSAKFARMPKGNHTGIWMMPAPPAEQWPKSGEIDIMEHLSAETKIYETIHSWYLDDMKITDPKGQGIVDIDPSVFNTYGVEWTKDSITFTVNGEKYLSYPNLNLNNSDAQWQWPFNHPFYLILSQSLGGPDTWAGPIDDAELPAEFVIDWIKVTQTSE